MTAEKHNEINPTNQTNLKTRNDDSNTRKTTETAHNRTPKAEKQLEKK